MRAALLVLLFIFAASAVSFQESSTVTSVEPPKNDSIIGDIKKEFKEFVHRHHKNYTAIEYIKHQAIYIKRKAEIIAHNLKYKAGLVGWNMTVSRFADMTVEEFKKSLGYKITNGTTDAVIASSAVSKRFGENIDWRARGKMGPVKDQKQCGSCWAFATTGATEGCVAISLNVAPPSLSEQQLQDCMFSKQCNPGGGGGADAIDWAKDHGINSEQSYPYTESNGQCHDTGDKWKSGGRVHGNTEDQLLNMLRTGPVLIGINAEPLMTYGGGVVDDAGLSRGRNHAVVVVGIQSNCHNGADCWIIRNSWGGGWAEQGHFRVMKGRNVIGLGDDSDMPVRCSAPNGGGGGGDRDGKYGRIENSDRPGEDLNGQPIQAGNVDDCQAKCFQNNDCKSWAFDSCGNNCWLKSGTPGAVGAGCRQSGIITAGRNGGGGGGGNNECKKEGYCPSFLCSCSGACYSADQYCCPGGRLTQKQFC